MNFFYLKLKKPSYLFFIFNIFSLETYCFFQFEKKYGHVIKTRSPIIISKVDLVYFDGEKKSVIKSTLKLRKLSTLIIPTRFIILKKEHIQLAINHKKIFFFYECIYLYVICFWHQFFFLLCFFSYFHLLPLLSFLFCYTCQWKEENTR